MISIINIANSLEQFLRQIPFNTSNIPIILTNVPKTIVNKPTITVIVQDLNYGDRSIIATAIFCVKHHYLKRCSEIVDYINNACRYNISIMSCKCLIGLMVPKITDCIVNEKDGVIQLKLTLFVHLVRLYNEINEEEPEIDKTTSI